MLLDEHSRACLADLGLAQVITSRARTARGQSLLYASPEQMLGERCTLAADVFSLGVLLIELITRTLCAKRGEWRLPRAPEDCPPVSAGGRGKRQRAQPSQEWRPTGGC